MKKSIDKIKTIGDSKKLTFSSDFYLSKDNKTVMGEISLKEILFLDYRDTEAGSNPREYNGLKKSNLKILQSFLSHQDTFRFLHSGIIVSLTDSSIRDKSIKYSDSCLTNGNQTRFIILILILLKLFSKSDRLNNIKRNEYNYFINDNFKDNLRIKSILSRIKFIHVSQIINYLNSHRKYLESFNSLELNRILDSRIRIQVNLIDSIVSDLGDEESGTYEIGSLIAEANNDTQNVKADDIFGNKYKSALQDSIFKDFLHNFKDKVEIEYRAGEIIGRKERVHMLTLLRPIVALGLLTKEKDIYKYTNQRTPVYKIFERLLRSKDIKVKNTVKTISHLIPLFYEIRTKYVLPQLGLLKKNFIREYTGKAIEGDLDDSVLKDKILEIKGDDERIAKIIRKNIGYNIEHIFPVLTYRIRKLFKEEPISGDVILTIPDPQKVNFFKTLIEVIYKKYIDLKLKGLPTSLTTVVRGKQFYELAEESYITFKNNFNFEETDYIEKNRFTIK